MRGLGGALVHCGEASAYGWCKYRWGLSWQINLRALAEPDPGVAKRVFNAMMDMVKIDIAAIEAAWQG